MVKYWKAIPSAIVLSLILLGLGGLVDSTIAIPETSSRSNSTNRNQDIERLKRSGQRWIEIRLRSQRLLAWQGNKLIYAVVASTGKSATPTPPGIFKIQSKHPTARMQGEDYNLADVPHVMYYSGNYAIHGAYWHRSFGVPVSHGCTNIAPDHANWLYSWAPIGTTVVIR